jgi:dihydrofolate synthase/folylpolyglutamate synthase
MNYREAETYLDQLQFFKIKLGLETTRALLAELGSPQDHLNIIHIAGTNGKGSVGATLLSILSAAGCRTGFYSSPHLSSVRERFQIGTAYISEDRFAQLVTRLQSFLGERQPPTYFEFTTLLALLWFQEEQTDVVILETGLGGRLDATNVVTPLLSIITDISTDHEQHLGTTLTAIAGEKAGIIKPGVPVVFSGREDEADPVIEQRCREQNSPLYRYGRDFSADCSSFGFLDYCPIAGDTRTGLPLALAGAHQIINTTLALAALELLENRFPVSRQELEDGLRQVRWPGRMELIPLPLQGKTLTFLLDGAHNKAGVSTLHQALLHGYPREKLVLIWGNMADKHIHSSLVALMSLADSIIFTRAESVRSAAPADLYAQVPQAMCDKTHCAETVEQALEIAQEQASSKDLICVAGSLYLVGRVRQQLLGEVAP